MSEAPLVAQRPGQLVGGKYRLERKLGQGAFGEVWLAQAPIGHVVVKLLHSQWARVPAVTERFRREAVAATRVAHDNVCRVYDYDLTEDQVPFIAMEYLTGLTLKEELKRGGPMTVGRLADVMAPVCEAVAAAHQVGIVHRDLKPENVMLTHRQGREVPVVLDFGIAKLLDSVDKLTQAGTLMGSPAYMSPEQCQGMVDIAPPADVYSLAIIAFELLIGRPPFTGRTLALTAMKHVMEPPPPLLGVPPQLAEMIATCLAKEPAERASAAALGAALRRAQQLAPDARAKAGETAGNPLLRSPGDEPGEQATVISIRSPSEIASEMAAHQRPEPLPPTPTHSSPPAPLVALMALVALTVIGVLVSMLLH